ncbi:unnamed protein product [Caenorhabditis angaria]|uniref:G-protein coupled receptors family 1 profile domain-containing protein n=1 Tax=Caenorhabditis angaria TaxID=860376 RepID=A0A9P1MZW1_9PELO|nr:unnamed protein product [Caenorhabditis angaria]
MDELFRTIHSFLSTFGCIINGTLIYAVLTRSPRQIKNYGLIIINFAITDFFICFLNFIVMQRLIACGYSIVYISLGPCSYFSSEICFGFYVSMLHFYTHSIWLLIFSFTYRYYVLFHAKTVTRLKVQIIILLIYIPSLFQLVNVVQNHTTGDIAKRILEEKHPEIEIPSIRMLSANPHIFDFSVLYVIIHVVGLSIPLTLAIVFLRYKTIKKLETIGNAKSAKSKRLQLQLMKALTFQAIIPIFYIIGGFCYPIQHFKQIKSDIPQYMMYCIFLLVPILNPISSFIFVGPYRNFILSKVKDTKYKMTSYTDRSATLI